MLRTIKSRVFQLYVLFFAFAMVVSTSLIVVQVFFFSDSAKEVSLQNGINKLGERETFFMEFLDRAEHQVTLIRELNAFKRYLSTHSKQSKNELTDFLLVMSRAHPSFMQVRFINPQGVESLRVERFQIGGAPLVVMANRLQDKSKRHYFNDSLSKPLEQVWFTGIDYNEEFGEVETPYKPTLRAIMPVSQKGEFAGLLVINYFSELFLKGLTNTPLYDMVLFDDQGETLYHYDPQKSWSAYFESRETAPQLYSIRLSSLKDFTAQKTDSFVVKKFNVPVQGGVNVLIKVNPRFLEVEAAKSKNNYITILFVVFLLSIVLTFGVVRFFDFLFLRTLETEKNNAVLLKQSRTDELTTLFNRQAFNTDLKKILQKQNRLADVFSMAMIDIDDFKKINDELGHDMGDEVLRDLGRYLRTSLRAQDSCYRVGGEEFVVIMPKTQLTDAINVCESICSASFSEASNKIGHRVTLSIGVTQAQEGDHVRTIYKRADELLYRAKRQGKNQVVSDL